MIKTLFYFLHLQAIFWWWTKRPNRLPIFSCRMKWSRSYLCNCTNKRTKHSITRSSHNRAKYST